MYQLHCLVYMKKRQLSVYRKASTQLLENLGRLDLTTSGPWSARCQRGVIRQSVLTMRLSESEKIELNGYPGLSVNIKTLPCKSPLGRVQT